VRIFLDTNIIIYFVQDPPGWGPRAAARLGALRAAGDVPVVSDLTRMECRVKPLQAGDAVLLAGFDAFFAAPGLEVVGLTAAVCDRATHLRATYNFKTPDALQLAAAIVHGCDGFLTNDTRLRACTTIPIEVLP
jgi:predicted nucleic acid-binding protein